MCIWHLLDRVGVEPIFSISYLNAEIRLAAVKLQALLQRRDISNGKWRYECIRPVGKSVRSNQPWLFGLASATFDLSDSLIEPVRVGLYMLIRETAFLPTINTGRWKTFFLPSSSPVLLVATGGIDGWLPAECQRRCLDTHGPCTRDSNPWMHLVNGYPNRSTTALHVRLKLIASWNPAMTCDRNGSSSLTQKLHPILSGNNLLTPNLFRCCPGAKHFNKLWGASAYTNRQANAVVHCRRDLFCGSLNFATLTSPFTATTYYFSVGPRNQQMCVDKQMPSKCAWLDNVSISLPTKDCFHFSYSELWFEGHLEGKYGPLIEQLWFHIAMCFA